TLPAGRPFTNCTYYPKPRSPNGKYRYNNENRKLIADMTRDSPSWFGLLVYYANKVLDEKNVPISKQSAHFVIQNAKAANENKIFSSTAHLLEALHWICLYELPESIDLRKPLTSLDPQYYLRGALINSLGAFWNCICPASEGEDFWNVGFDPAMDVYPLLKREEKAK
ncbi:hypothetical protein OQJ46_06670, partial [Microbulbifer thermotolerans]|uniref:hypothetical protein n=1 Tax=Microbulbifer thermotolerans TaxID=252514 RepID=UPI00224ABC8A